MDEYLPFENTIFCSRNCNCLRFSAHSLSLLLISLLFIFNNVLTAVNTTIKYLLPKFHVMFKFNYSKYNPRGLISGGGLDMEGVFRFKSWFLNAPGLIHGGAYYRTVCVTFHIG